jgi:hypothetical protein
VLPRLCGAAVPYVNVPGLGCFGVALAILVAELAETAFYRFVVGGEFKHAVPRPISTREGTLDGLLIGGE